MNQEAAEKLTLARSRLIMDQTFFGVLALRLIPEERLDLPYKTLGVDGRKLFYDPEWILEQPIDMCITGVAHEVMHCALTHMLRREGRDPHKWNAAADYAINLILADAGFTPIPGWLLDRKYEGMSADEIYLDLPDSAAGFCMIYDGNADGNDVSDGAGTLEMDWSIATVQAAEAARTIGKLPGGLARLLKDITAPPIPWKDVLATFMTERVKDDYSWRRSNPFYSRSGFMLPIMDGVGMGEVVIALDTSGSVQSVLDEFGSTVRSILDATRPSRVHVIYCDAEVNRVDVFERGQSVNFETVGGGGTAFEPVFEYVENAGIQPACLLYLTDMYGSFPPSAPAYPVLWCATSETTGPFGQTIRIKD